MNESYDFLSDDVLNELLTPYRVVAVPDKAQRTNRAALQRALIGRTQLTWWRQTIAVPVPVAVAAILTVVISLTANLRPARIQSGTAHVASHPTSDQLNQREPVARSENKSVSGSSWSVTRSYIESLGSVVDGTDHFRG
jgi:hypothetical protein